MNLAKKNLKLKVDNRIFIKVIKPNEVTKSYVQWLKDYEVTKYTDQNKYSHSLASTKSYVSQKFNSENDLLFGIFFDNFHIGNIKLGPIDFENKSSNISYFIGEKSFWGQGIVSKCIKTLTQFAIIDLGMIKIIAGYYENNIGSAKALDKCGFVFEKIKVGDAIFEDKPINNILVAYTLK